MPYSTVRRQRPGEYFTPPSIDDDARAIADYAEAKRTIRELRHLDSVLWIPTPDGTIVA